jgi:hypothetical protein
VFVSELLHPTPPESKMANVRKRPELPGTLFKPLELFNLFSSGY